MKSPLNGALDRKRIGASATITKLERELAALRAKNAELYKKGRQLVKDALSDPHDEREVSVEWLRKRIRASFPEEK